MSNEDKWMSCTSCHAVVQLNATGVCLGCQGGFGGQAEEDKYMPIETTHTLGSLPHKPVITVGIKEDLEDRKSKLEEALIASPKKAATKSKKIGKKNDSKK